MATPYGHALVGLSLLNLWFPKFSSEKRTWSLYGLIILGACLPDLDFIPGLLLGHGGRFHHGIFHSAGMAIVATLSVWIIVCGFQRNPHWLKIGGLIFCLTFSHLFLDFFTEAPKGFPLFWPFSEAPYLSPVPIFPRVERNWVYPQLWSQVRLCFLVETFLLVPLWMASWRVAPKKS